MLIYIFMHQSPAFGLLYATVSFIPRLLSFTVHLPLAVIPLDLDLRSSLCVHVLYAILVYRGFPCLGIQPAWNGGPFA